MTEERLKQGKVLRAKDLFGEGREVLIEHENSCYRLILTKSGKLILNK